MGDTGNDIITNCNSIMLQNNKKIPGIFSDELEKAYNEKHGKGKGKLTKEAYMENEDARIKAKEERTGIKQLRWYELEYEYIIINGFLLTLFIMKCFIII